MITLENDRLSVQIDEGTGGRVESFRDRGTQEEWAWHPKGYVPQERILDIGSPFDPHWTGGWEDVFPNDMADKVLGYQLVDHGELWSRRWTVEEQGRFKARLTLECRSMPLHVEKTFFLDEGKLTLTYAFRNQGHEALPVLFKFHAAVPIAPGDRFVLPDCEIEPVSLDFSRMIGKSGRTRFPFGKTAGGEDVRVDTVPDERTRSREFFYAMNLAEGYCGLRKEKAGELRFTFNRQALPYVWVFQSYHLFQDHWVAILEPCTTMPYDLNEAYRAGTTAVVQPGLTLDIEIGVEIVRHE